MAFLICYSTWWRLVSLSQQLEPVFLLWINLQLVHVCTGMWHDMRCIYLCSCFMLWQCRLRHLLSLFSLFLTLSSQPTFSLFPVLPPSFLPSLFPHRAGVGVVMHLPPQELWKVSMPSPLANWSPSVSRTSSTAPVSSSVRGQGCPL